MKKQVVLLILTMCAFMNGYAQFGLQVGANVSSYRLIRAGKHEVRSPKMGFNAGILYRTKGKTLSIQPTFLYTQKGTINNNIGRSYTDSVLKYRNKLDYLEFSMPLILKAPFAGPKNSFDIGVGPYYGKLITASSKAIYDNGHKKTNNFKTGNSSKDDFTTTDYGLCIYMGGHFTHFNMSLVYNLGIPDVCPGSDNIKNRCFSFNMGVFF